MFYTLVLGGGENCPIEYDPQSTSGLHLLPSMYDYFIHVVLDTENTERIQYLWRVAMLLFWFDYWWHAIHVQVVRPGKIRACMKYLISVINHMEQLVHHDQSWSKIFQWIHSLNLHFVISLWNCFWKKIKKYYLPSNSLLCSNNSCWPRKWSLYPLV